MALFLLEQCVLFAVEHSVLITVLIYQNDDDRLKVASLELLQPSIHGGVVVLR